MSAFDAFQARHRAVRIALYNHKGGVGKTTLTVNIAAALAAAGKRVLLVDSDPQCNLTSYYLADEFIDKLLAESDSSNGRTVWSALKPVYDNAAPPRNVTPYELSRHKNLFLLPGDIQLSKYETELVRLWDDCFQRKPRGFNGTIAISKVLNAISTALDFDYIFYDCGPNVGALNRVILLDVDYFVVPGACDQFSVRALTTLGIQLREWMHDWRTIQMLAPDDVYPMPGRARLMGYILQRFRMYGREMTASAAGFADQFSNELRRNIAAVLSAYDKSLTPIDADNLELGAVRDFGGRANNAQLQGMMLSEVGSPEQKAEATKVFRQIARRVIERSTD